MIFYMIACMVASLQYSKSIIIHLLYVFHIFIALCYYKTIKKRFGRSPKRTTTHHSTNTEWMKEREVFIMKKILDKVSEFFREYYVSFGERIWCEHIAKLISNIYKVPPLNTLQTGSSATPFLLLICCSFSVIFFTLLASHRGQKKAVRPWPRCFRVMIAQLIWYTLFDSVNFNVNLKSVCELAIHAVSTIQTSCCLMSFLQFNLICTILCT